MSFLDSLHTLVNDSRETRHRAYVSSNIQSERFAAHPEETIADMIMADAGVNMTIDNIIKMMDVNRHCNHAVQRMYDEVYQEWLHYKRDVRLHSHRRLFASKESDIDVQSDWTLQVFAKATLYNLYNNELWYMCDDHVAQPCAISKIRKCVLFRSNRSIKRTYDASNIISLPIPSASIVSEIDRIVSVITLKHTQLNNQTDAQALMMKNIDAGVESMQIAIDKALKYNVDVALIDQRMPQYINEMQLLEAAFWGSMGMALESHSFVDAIDYLKVRKQECEIKYSVNLSDYQEVVRPMGSLRDDWIAMSTSIYKENTHNMMNEFINDIQSSVCDHFKTIHNAHPSKCEWLLKFTNDLESLIKDDHTLNEPVPVYFEHEHQLNSLQTLEQSKLQRRCMKSIISWLPINCSPPDLKLIEDKCKANARRDRVFVSQADDVFVKYCQRRMDYAKNMNLDVSVHSKIKTLTEYQNKALNGYLRDGVRTMKSQFNATTRPILLPSIYVRNELNWDIDEEQWHIFKNIACPIMNVLEIKQYTRMLLEPMRKILQSKSPPTLQSVVSASMGLLEAEILKA